MIKFYATSTPKSVWEKLNREVMRLYINQEVFIIATPSESGRKQHTFHAVISDNFAIVHCMDEIWFVNKEEYKII